MPTRRLLLVPALTALALLAGCDHASSPASAAPAPTAGAPAAAPLDVDTVEVKAEPLPRWLPLTGNLVPLEDAQVAAGAAGKVLSTAVERGQTVKQGDVMVRLDGRIASAQAAAAQAQVEVAKAQLESATADCERSTQLFKGGGVAASQHQRTLAQCRTAEAQLAAAQAQARLANSNLSDMSIRAPFDGVVAERMISAGEYVGPSSPVVGLISSNAMRLELTVPAQSAGEVRAGQVVEFAVGRVADGKAYKSTVTHVGASLRKSSRDLVIEALVDGKEVPLPPGSFVNARLRLEDAPLPVVPAKALRQGAGQSRLFVVVDGRLEERMVQVSEVRGDVAGIIDGVRPGETVVATATSELRDGAAVK